MNWFYLYLVAGCLFLLAFLVRQYCIRTKSASSLLDDWKGNNPKVSRLTLIGRAAILFIAALTFGLLTVVVWPVVLAIEVWELFSNRKRRMNLKKPVFEVKKSDLIQPHTREEIEAIELVVDPLQAVPSLPFGHLHAAWKKYLEEVQPEDALWSFSAYWQGSLLCDEQAVGYVVVRGKRIGPYFLAGIRSEPWRPRT